MTKVTVISGFLGAGKTTLIKKLLKEAYKDEKIVLIENEFGEIGIDGGFLKDAGVQVSEMNSGCICCSLVGDFGTALKEVITTYAPDRILIEPSGVGKLSDVEKAVERVAAETEIELTASIAVVDANKAKVYMKNFGEFFSNQVESAKAIILSRTQNVTQNKLEACVNLLREHNENATIITTPWDELCGEQILQAMEQASSMEEELMKEAHEHHHHHDHECCGHDHNHEHHHDHECCGHEHDHEHHHDHESCGHDHDHDHHHHNHDCCDHDHDHKHHDHDHGCCCGHNHDHHHHHHAEEVFTSWGKETPAKYTKDEITEILKTLAETEEAGNVLRAKGMVGGADGSWIYFDMVPGEYEVREGQAEYTGRICVIGTDLKEDKLAQMFHI